MNQERRDEIYKQYELESQKSTARMQETQDSRADLLGSFRQSADLLGDELAFMTGQKELASGFKSLL